MGHAEDEGSGDCDHRFGLVAGEFGRAGDEKGDPQQTQYERCSGGAPSQRPQRYRRGRQSKGPVHPRHLGAHACQGQQAGDEGEGEAMREAKT